MKTGALIIASSDFQMEDRGSEEYPAFLPMYPLDGTTVIKREIAAFRKEGLSPIVVLAGYQKEILKTHLSHNGVIFAEDDQYGEHDREAAFRIGMETARSLMDRVVMLPVECPSFSAHTLQTLLQCEKNAVPVYQDQEGYPRICVLEDLQGREPERILVPDAGVILSLLDRDGIRQAERYAKEQRSANELRCGLRLILTKEDDFFGPGTCELLQYIDETGSINAAAKKMKMSYTKCWKMVNQAEKEMGFPFLERCNGGKNGGSSTLTEEGRLFLERYRAMMEDMKRVSRNFFDTYFRDFQ